MYYIGFAVITGIFLLGAIMIIVPFWLKPEHKWVYIISAGPGALILLVSLFGYYGFFKALPQLRAMSMDIEQYIDEPAPSLTYTLLGVDGEFKLEESEGNVVLVNLWATWCPPCVKEMPDLSKLAQTYPGELTVLCLSDEDVETVASWVDEREELHQQVGFFNRELFVEPYSKVLAVRPMTFIIDRDGNMREIIRGSRTFEEFEAYIKPYLDESLAEL